MPESLDGVKRKKSIVLLIIFYNSSLYRRKIWVLSWRSYGWWLLLAASSRLSWRICDRHMNDDAKLKSASSLYVLTTFFKKSTTSMGRYQKLIYIEMYLLKYWCLAGLWLVCLSKCILANAVLIIIFFEQKSKKNYMNEGTR